MDLQGLGDLQVPSLCHQQPVCWNMEIGSFVVSIAGTVLGRAISYLISKQLPRMSSDEVRKEVASEVRAQDGSWFDDDDGIAQLADSVLSEISELADRDPDVRVEDGAIEVVQPPRPIFRIRAQAARQGAIHKRLNRLHRLIEQRQQEVLRDPETLAGDGIGHLRGPSEKAERMLRAVERKIEDRKLGND